MRRERTSAEWMCYALGAGVVLMIAAVVLSAIGGANCQKTIGELRQQIEMQEATGTGGAEVPIPTFKREAEWRFPLLEADYRVYTSPFGYRVSPFLDVEMFHEGLDIVGVWRSRVVAVADGVVTVHYPPPDGYWRGHDTYGGMITITHDDGMQTLYAHMSDTKVHTDDRVFAGQVIGRTGDTGKSDGEHLHIEVRAPDGTLQNPALFIQDPREE